MNNYEKKKLFYGTSEKRGKLLSRGRTDEKGGNRSLKIGVRKGSIEGKERVSIKL